jgi:hypothetical protein
LSGKHSGCSLFANNGGGTMRYLASGCAEGTTGSRFRRFYPFFYKYNFVYGKKVLSGNAQGIEAVSFFAIGKKDTSGNPGPAAGRMRPYSYF